MPRLSQWIIRVAFIYLLLGFTIGALLLANKGILFYPPIWNWLPVHIEFLLMGWIVQLTMGVAFWILPRFWQEPRRPNEIFAYIAFALLNLGIGLVVVATLLGGKAYWLLSGRAAQLLAVIFFVLHAWRRVIPREG